MRASLSRRRFLVHSLAAGTGAGMLVRLDRGRLLAATDPGLPEPSAAHLPRWRGFNLLEKFNGQNQPFREEDFAWIAELGFDFVRLPMDYRGWIEDGDWTKFRETTLREIDDAVRFGQKHGIHVCLNFHRAPGYTVAQPPEPKSLWTGDEALRICALHWGEFARRYRDIPNRCVSFNLLNEPPKLEPAAYRRVVSRLLEAIREHDPKRLVICDGREWGNAAPTELAGLNVAAAGRGYQPVRISHFRANWMAGADQWPEPTYPLKEGDINWDRETLRRRCIEPWRQLEARGVGVMIGEFGAHNRTPHAVVLAWLQDLLALWKDAGWGWALWNWRGSFGVLDSGRGDVAYEVWRGHQLDRKLLRLLQAA
ncbi:MAG: cellulase family glycosylhydrolase [Verrucomicrobiota bacterium]